MKQVSQRLRSLLYRLALRMAAALPRGQPRSFRITILKLDRLGDAVLSLGAVRQLVTQFGESGTLLIVSPIAEPLFRLEFPRVTLFVLPAFCGHYWPDFIKFLWQHAGQLRSISTDALIVLRHQPSDYLHAIAQLIGPRITHASRWDRAWESICLAYPKVKQVPYPSTSPAGTCLELEAHRYLLCSLLGRDVTLEEVIPAFASIKSPGGEMLLVCPQAGASIREYPPSLLAEALRLFLARCPLPLHFCVLPDTDVAPWQKVLADAGVSCTRWHQPKTFQALLELMASARLVLAPESAPAHIATALNKAGVFIEGGGHFGIFAPWSNGPRQLWLHHEMDCYECRWHCRYNEAHCITDIPPLHIAEALERVIQIG